MTENRRIVLNIVATYGRSLFSLACGIFGGRWALMSLGTVDYGLHGVVGGLTAFIGFINGILGASMGRFYAYAVGQARVSGSDGLEECRRWFSIAVLIHTTIPAVLLAIGWPVGEWVICNFLTIPTDRVSDCLWVFRFSCIGCLVGMTAVPFHAMYGAKQYIAELTIYSFVSTMLNVFVLYYMASHPSVWLVKYSLWLTVLGVAPSLIISIRSVKLFPECRFRLDYCFDRERFCRLFVYSFWQTFGSVSELLRLDVIAVLANKYFGPAINAALAIARNVSGKADQLAASMLGAFSPAITSAYGAGDVDRAYSLVLRVCKFGVLASAVFVVPLAVELDYVMRLWLVEPPEFVTMFCYAVMLQKMVNRISKGHTVLMHADGRLGPYETYAAAVAVLMVGLGFLAMYEGVGPSSICFSLIGIACCCGFARPLFTRYIIGMPISGWLRKVLVPVLSVIALSLVVGFGIRSAMPSGFVRLLMVIAACESVLLPLSWICVFDNGERECVITQLVKLFGSKQK